MGSRLILPDTNILIRGFAGFKPIDTYLHRWITQDRLILSVVVIAEYLVRASSTDTGRFEELIQEFSIIEVDLDTARLAAQIRRNSLKRKIKLHLPDCLLAAQAQIHHATLATLNPHDFPASVPTFKFK